MDSLHQLTLLIKAIPVAFAALFPVINPIGTAIILIGMTGALDASTRRHLAKKIAINTFLLLFVVLLGGSYLLAFFGITIQVVQAAGGLVLAAMGWSMLTQEAPQEGSEQETTVPLAKLGDQLFYPFTFPVTVGPGGIAVALTLSAHSQHGDFSVVDIASRQLGSVVGIAAVCVLVYLSFAYSDLFARRLGPSGTKVLLRLMAFLVVCLGAEIFWSGASVLLKGILVR